jgi:hypothetical protein
VLLAANLIFGVGGAIVFCLLAEGIKPDGARRFPVIVAILTGVVAGLVGYVWLDWALSHAEPPL